MAYDIRVRAVNSEGASVWSAATQQSMLPAATVASTPVAPTLTTDSTSSVTASWVAPDDGGSSITSYDLRYRVGSNGVWMYVNNVSATAYTVTGLTPNTTLYQFQVWATNTNGDSAYSASSSITTLATEPDPVSFYFVVQVSGSGRLYTFDSSTSGPTRIGTSDSFGSDEDSPESLVYHSSTLYCVGADRRLFTIKWGNMGIIEKARGQVRGAKCSTELVFCIIVCNVE